MSAEYERIVAGSAQTMTTTASDSDELDREARRRMDEDHTLGYRAALLEAAKMPKKPSDRIASVKTPAAEDPAVRAYADANTLTYDAALLALAKLGLEAEPEEETQAATGVRAATIPTPTPTPAQIRVHAKARGIKASAALVELIEGR